LHPNPDKPEDNGKLGVSSAAAKKYAAGLIEKETDEVSYEKANIECRRNVFCQF